MQLRTLMTAVILMISPALSWAESSCPSGYDFAINNFKAKKAEFAESERANIVHIANQLVAQLDEIEQLDVYGHGATWNNFDTQAMSELRAEYVLDEIVAEVERQIGKEVEFYIYYRGFGDSCPVATNDTQAGRASNRRVQVKITRAAPAPSKAQQWCDLTLKLRDAPTDKLAKNRPQRNRLKFLRNFISDGLCLEKVDDQFYRFDAKNGMGLPANACGTSKAIMSAKRKPRSFKAVKRFKKLAKLDMNKKQLAKQVKRLEQDITCELNKVLAVVQSLSSETPAVDASDECAYLLEFSAASKRTAPQPTSVYRGWRRMIVPTAKVHCEL